MESLTQASKAVSFDQMPAEIGRLNDKIDRLESLIISSLSPSTAAPVSKYVDINGAAEITSKTPNALRVQISLRNLKSIKKGSRHYFEREYLERWIAGEQNEKGSKNG